MKFIAEEHLLASSTSWTGMPLIELGRSQASARRSKRLPLRPRNLPATGETGRLCRSSSKSSDSKATTTTTRAISSTLGYKRNPKHTKKKRHPRYIPLFDQETLANTELNHRKECGIRGPHAVCDICMIPPLVPLGEVELQYPRMSRVTFFPKVVVKPIAHRDDIRRRGGEWETLRESLDREDEYILPLNDIGVDIDQHVEGEVDEHMSGVQPTSEEESDEWDDETEVEVEDFDGVDRLSEGPKKVHTEQLELCNCNTREESERAEKSPSRNGCGMINHKIKIHIRQSQSEVGTLVEGRNGTVHMQYACRTAVATAGFVNGFFEEYVLTSGFPEDPPTAGVPSLTTRNDIIKGKQKLHQKNPPHRDISEAGLDLIGERSGDQTSNERRLMAEAESESPTIQRTQKCNNISEPSLQPLRSQSPAELQLPERKRPLRSPEDMENGIPSWVIKRRKIYPDVKVLSRNL